MDNNKISVIVPVYNVEQYLQKCVDSIINQTFANLEIILVDDGSTDSSGKMCDEYLEKDKRIRVIHKENGGLSDARNAAIDVMTGKYVTFVDSDDYIALDLIEKLFDIMKKNDADISCVSHYKVFENQDIKKQEEIEDVVLFSGVEAIEQILYRKELDTSAWGKLYKSEYFEEIRYPKGLIFEDLATTYKLFYKANRVVYSSVKMYYYLQRQGSIMYQSFKANRFDRVKISQQIIEWCENTCPVLKEAAIARYFTANIQLLREIPVTKQWKGDIKEIQGNLKKYRKNVLTNKQVKVVDKIIAASTCLGVRPMKLLGVLYKLIWP